MKFSRTGSGQSLRRRCRARYYNPRSGRFLSEDPIGFAGKDYNFYRYVGNNPVGNLDPSGNSPLLWVVIPAMSFIFPADDLATIFREEGPIKPIKYDVPELERAADPQKFEDILERKEIEMYLKKYEKKKKLEPGTCKLS